jgi:predicted Holliday junction resolvase-like endonuclease
METITFIILAIVFIAIGYVVGKLLADAKWRHERVPLLREEAIAKSRQVLTGQFSEQLAPYFPDFKYSPTEVRFLGKPIDFIVFRGMDEKNIGEVVFVEVKSGKSKINRHERNLKETIESGRVRWEEYRMGGSQKDKDLK